MINRIYGQLEGMRIPKALLLNLERNNLCTSTYVSNSIEGNPLSLPEVTNLLLDDRVPTNRSEKEVRNYFDILHSLQTRIQEHINVPLMLSIHKQLLTNVDDRIAGRIRSERVVVGRYDSKGAIHVRHEPPAHDEKGIVRLLQELNDWATSVDLPPVLQAALFHHQFVYIHPFADGNGRTCRLLTALLLLRHGYLINKYFVLDDYYDVDRQGYADALQSADGGDTTRWLEYFTDGMVYSLKSAMSRIKIGLTQLSVPLRPTNREQDALECFQSQRELKSGDVAKKLRVSRQQAHNLLTSLVRKGYVEKKGGTKSSYYVLL